VPAALLAAAAGATFFSNPSAAIPSLMALIASALTTTSTFLNPNSAAARHHRAGVLYGDTRRKLRQFIHVDSQLTTADKALPRLSPKPTQQVAKIQADSPPIGKCARKIAKQEIDSGSADYTDDELQKAAGEPTA